MWAAVILLLGQGAIIGTLLYFVRTFGSYTDALLRAHESNLAVRAESIRMLNEIQQHRQAPLTQGKVA